MVMSFNTAREIFLHTVSVEPRVKAPINDALRAMANRQEDIELASDTVQGAGRVWLTSDWHFNHAEIIGFSDRPFHNVQSMNNALFAQLRRVQKNELLVILGDVIFNADEDETAEMLISMPAKKILVTGNHDFEKYGKSKFAQIDYVFEAVVPFLTYEGRQGRHVMMTHYPVVLPEHYNGNPVINYHGHLHQWHMPLDEARRVKHINVGWDATHGLVVV